MTPAPESIKTIWQVAHAALTLISNLVELLIRDQQLVLAQINTRVTQLAIRIEENQAMTQADFTAVLDSLDEATTESAVVAKSISDQLSALRTQLLGLGLSTADAAAVLLRITASQHAASDLAAALDAMATDPANPVPIPVPPPQPEPPPR